MIAVQAAPSSPLVTVVATGPRCRASQLLERFAPVRPAPDLSPPALLHPQPSADHAQLLTATAQRMAHEQPDLWNGNWQKVTRSDGLPLFPSQSEADYALACAIARALAATQSSGSALPPLVEAVFSLSALAQRTKWQDRADYRQSTARRACAGIVGTRDTAAAGAPPVDWNLEGDIRNARFFADMWRGKLRYIAECQRWLAWRDDHWSWCASGQEVEHAKPTAIALLTAATQELMSDVDRGRRLVREATKASDQQRITAMLQLARSDPQLAIAQASLDNDPELLGVQNGIVQLRTGRLEPNRPDLHLTRYCRAGLHDGAACPRWLQFLDEVFQGDQATINSVQRLAGYTLVGTSTEEIIIFCVGFGANGKSIFGNVLAAIMGDYAVTAPPSLLGQRRADDHGPRSDLAMLPGARLVSINELPAGLQLDEQVVKQLAGREAITARHLYGKYFTFQPHFTPWVRTNHKPIIRGDDEGIWRRIVVLPFRRRFTPAEQDPQLERRLLAESNGILAWMVEGARLYLHSGLQVSPAIRAEQTQYRCDSDLLGEFLEECTLPGLGTRVNQQSLYEAWEAWCRQNGVHPSTKKSFTQRLAERGHPAGKSNGGRFYVGLTLRGLFDTGQQGQV